MKLVNVFKEIERINKEGILPNLSVADLVGDETYNVVIDATIYEDEKHEGVKEHLIASIIDIKDKRETFRDFGNIINGLNTSKINSFNRIKNNMNIYDDDHNCFDVVSQTISDNYKIKVTSMKNIGINIEVIKFDDLKRPSIKFSKYINLNDEHLSFNILSILQSKLDLDTVTTYQYNLDSVIEETAYISSDNREYKKQEV